MLDTALSIIVDELNTFIGSLEPEVVPGNISFIDAFQENSAESLNDRVVASIINIHQEGALRNLPFRRSSITPAGLPEGIEQPPEINLNVYVLFGANKRNYLTALQRISQVIAFFQRQFVFTQTDLPALAPLNVDKLIFDLYSVSFEELSQIWGMIGGKYIPSVVYKMRLAVIQDAPTAPTGLISEIGLHSGLSNPVAQ